MEESDDILNQKLAQAEARLLELEEESKDTSSDLLNASTVPSSEKAANSSSIIGGDSFVDGTKEDEYNWAFEDVAQLSMDSAVKLVDVDSVDGRLFVLCDDLTLTEVSLESHQVVQQLNVAQLDGAGEALAGQKALAFAMFKDLNMIAISSEHGVHLFDYEHELQHVKSLNVSNVVQICFIDMYIVTVMEDEDSGEAVLQCFMIDNEEPEAEIKIKQFLGQKVKVQPSDQSVCFAIGQQIGRI